MHEPQGAQTLHRRTRFCGNAKINGITAKVYIYYFSSKGGHRLTSPPTLTATSGLQVGDVFMHEHSGSYQFWLRVGSGTRGERWMSIELGYEREDRRVLALTDGRKDPSWLESHWYEKRLLKRE